MRVCRGRELDKCGRGIDTKKMRKGRDIEEVVNLI